MGITTQYLPPSLHLVPFCQLRLVFSGVRRRVVKGGGLGSPGCVVFFYHVYGDFMSYVVDSAAM